MAAPGIGPSGIRRKVDDLGRVVIPAGVRRALNIREGDTVEIAVEGERVVLAKPRDACLFCGREDDDLPVFRGRRLCQECLASLSGLDAQVRAVADADAAGTEPIPPTSEEAAPAVPPEPDVSATAAAGSPRGAAHPQEATPTGRLLSDTARSGPVDGDALTRGRDDEPQDDEPPRRRRPTHGPASTTAW